MTALPTPPAATPGHPRRWVILAVICLAQLVVLLDNTVLNVAIPSLTAELHASTADIQWMINAYSLVQAGLLLAAGNAADRYGRKRLLLTGLALFGAGSLAAGLAGSAGQLIAARAGMGVGGAMLLTCTLAVVMQVFDPSEHTRAIGVWAAVNALGFAGGPLLGGIVLDHFWWGAIFLINLPIALLALAAVVVLVPESRNPLGDRPDLIGAVLSTIGMASTVYAIISGPEHGWTSAHVVIPAAVGTVVLAVFAVYEARIPYPMLDMSFFRNPRFTGALCGAVLVTFGMGGSLFLLTQLLQFGLGHGPLEAGLRTAPFALTVVLVNFSGLGARWSRRIGVPRSLGVGMGLLAAGLTGVALSGSDGYGGTLAGLVVMGVGVALANPAMAAAIMGAIPPEKAGVGAGVNGTVAEFGTGLGVAVLGAVLASATAARLPFDGDSLPATLAAHPGERDLILDAFASGVTAGLLVGAVAIAAGGLLAAWLLRRADARQAAEQTAPAEAPQLT
ncbi:MFS transporter [Streptomyces sp. NPDC060194]|uniref:MFS transporter n=1 Tax=Streptomyces sp. NPDC060194 TaxID=3347069 RepID=UPI00365CF7AE